jgi:hypothetical protein
MASSVSPFVLLPNAASSFVSESDFNYSTRDVEIQAFRVLNPDLTVLSRHGGSLRRSGSADRTAFAFENGMPMQGNGLFPGNSAIALTPSLSGESSNRGFALFCDAGGITVVDRGVGTVGNNRVSFAPGLVVPSHGGQWRSLSFPGNGRVSRGRASSCGVANASCSFAPFSSVYRNILAAYASPPSLWSVSGALNETASCFAFTVPTSLLCTSLVIQLRNADLSGVKTGRHKPENYFG